MQTVGPTTFAVGVATPVIDPAGKGGNPSAAVQIQNSSSYQITVNAGGAGLSIQPFTAQTLRISTQPLTITPLAGVGSGACSITLAFLLATSQGDGEMLSDGTWVEASPVADGSLTAQAIEASISGLISTQGEIDFLGTFNYNLAGAGVPDATNVVALNVYNEIVVVASLATGTPLACFTVSDTTFSFPSPKFGCVLTPAPASGTAESQGAVPFLNQKGDTIQVTPYAGGAGTGSFSIFGLTNGNLAQLIRSDGRAYPVGKFSVLGGAATANFIPAPANPLRVLLSSGNVSVSGAAGAQYVIVQGTINGNVVDLMQATAGNNGGAAVPLTVPPGGILLDGATAVSLITVGAPPNIRATLVYDLVV
jgi:hypothetical protein